jgi:hypothetical protein
MKHTEMIFDAEYIITANESCHEFYVEEEIYVDEFGYVSHVNYGSHMSTFYTVDDLVGIEVIISPKWLEDKKQKLLKELDKLKLLET